MDARIRIRIHTKMSWTRNTEKYSKNSKPEGRDGHGSAHVEVFIEPESEMSLAGAHHQARGPASHNIVVLPRPAVYLTTKNIFIFFIMKDQKAKVVSVHNFVKNQCCGSGSVCFWASWIRIRIH
jgi:hypothetical protein